MFFRIARWVPANGILFAALVVIGAVLTNDRPGTSASNAELAAYYVNGSNRTKEVVAFFLIALSAICFLSFLGSLRGVLARAEGEPARLTTTVTASGAVFIALAVAAHAVGTATAWGAENFDSFTVDADSAKLMMAVSFGFYALALAASASMALATCVLALHTKAMPRSIAIGAAVAAAAGIATFFVPVASVLVLAWIVAVSAWMLVPGESEAPATAPTVSA